MRRILTFSTALLLFLALAVPLRAQVDVTGTWELKQATPRGERTMTLTLTQEGTNVTGMIAMPTMGRPGGGGGGGQTVEIEIHNGKLEGERLTFTTTRRMGQRSITQTFEATVSGDSMEGQSTVSGGRGGMEPVPFTGQRKEG